MIICSGQEDEYYIYIYNVACTFVSTLKEHFLHAQSCKLRSYTKEYRYTVEFVNICDKFQEVYYTYSHRCLHLLFLL